MKVLLKRIARELSAGWYARTPVQEWSPLAGRIHEISIPQGIQPHPKPLPEGSANINIILDLLKMTRDVPGDLAECGVFRGKTIVPIGLTLKQTGSSKHVFGFDSFEGFPDNMAVDMALGGRGGVDRFPGGMNETSLDLVSGKLRRFGLENVTLVKGYFENTLPGYRDRTFSFVHLDCDIYSSYKECMEFFYPRVNPGGVILLDEYNDPPWPGCNKALDEFLAGKPEKLEPIVRDNFVKYYLKKLPAA